MSSSSPSASSGSSSSRKRSSADLSTDPFHLPDSDDDESADAPTHKKGRLSSDALESDELDASPPDFSTPPRVSRTLDINMRQVKTSKPDAFEAILARLVQSQPALTRSDLHPRNLTSANKSKPINELLGITYNAHRMRLLTSSQLKHLLTKLEGEGHTDMPDGCRITKRTLKKGASKAPFR
jgi:hypothetical protein